MEKQEFNDRCLEISYHELVDLATDIIDSKSIELEKLFLSVNVKKENGKLQYHINIDEDSDNIKNHPEIKDFYWYFKNNFSQYNIDNEKQDYNITKRERTLYFNTPKEALSNLVRALKRWKIEHPDIKKDYFNQFN